MSNASAEEAPGSANTPTVPTGGGDVEKLKLKGVLNMEERLLMTATSKNPSKEDQSPAGNINPLLLMSARRGSWEALNVLLQREDAKNPPMMLPTQEFLQLLGRGSSAQGRAAARDVEEGGDLHPAASVAAGALLKGVTPDGDTVLHAVASNRWDGQNFLDYAGIIYQRDSSLLFAKNHKGGTPLHCAARAGNSKMVSHLIDLAGREDADMKLKLLRMENNRHETALHEAVRFEDGRILVDKDRQALLDAADPAREENNEDDADSAPVDKNIVKLLMGVDPELANYPAHGISPLYLAISLEKSTIALTLYDMSGGNLSYSGADGQNALHISIFQDIVMIDFLLHWNKSLSTQVDRDGSTPLHFASSLFFLTSSYLRFELRRRPPWCRYVRRSLYPAWALKIIFKANPAALYQADKDGSFPIHVAASVGARGAIQFFHDKCPDSVGLRDAKGRTFLHVAVEKRQLGIVSYACRTSPLAWVLNIEDNDGNTALHLAIQVGNLRMFCALFGNMDVNINLINNHGETPLDLSRSKIPRRLNYGQNSEFKILDALWYVGANTGALRRDKANEKYSWIPKPEDKDKHSEMMKDASQTFIVAAVLIATVAFTAAFAVPGGYRGDDHTNGGTPTLAGGYVFDAFMMATTLAFICSSLATVGFVLAANHMVSLPSRNVNFKVSVRCMWSSVTCLSIAFALGVYMVLAPVARSTAVVVCVISPAILLSSNMEIIIKLAILAQPLCIRKGLYPGIVQLVKMHMFTVVSALWPFIVTFGWAALARIHRHR